MNVANHALTGALIALNIKEPAIALPLAFTSHFVLDALPHFGFRTYEERVKHKLLMNIVIAVDFLLGLGVMVLLLRTSISWLVLTSAVVASAPDLAWVYRYIIPERLGTKPPSKGNWFNEWHSKIQKREFKEGFIIEYLVLLGLCLLLGKNLRG